MILLIDNYDSFTYNLVDYLEQIGAEVKVIRNDAWTSELNVDSVKGVLLSPGPETPSSAGPLLKIVDTYIGKLPMLGICLGHQAIAQHLGATISNAKKPMHGKISSIEYQDSPLFRGLPKCFKVVRYHSLVAQDLSENIKPTSFTKEKELMSFDVLDKMAHGLQFHPEAILTEYGIDILRNWVNFYNIV